MKAGYVVTAIDAFADAQTVAVAKQAIVVAYGRQGFDAEALLAALDGLDLSQFAGVAYGSGFEAQPELLADISAKLPLIGNSADTVAAVKNPAVFFAALQRLNINHPRVSYALPDEHANDYLLKFAGGSGGAHIRSAGSHGCLLEHNYYYQQKIDGQPVSLLFLANKHDIEVIGFNEQWLDPAADAPYRYGGAVSNVELSTCVQQQLIDAARKLTREFSLQGLNSLDAIVETAGSDRVFVLEINPRLSATVDLYSFAKLNLLQRHVDICLNADDLSQYGADQSSSQFKAHAIVYALAETTLPAPLSWPDWVTDTPLLGENVVTISAGAPACSVYAHADSAEAAKKLAQSRVKLVQNLLQSFH